MRSRSKSVNSCDKSKIIIPLDFDISSPPLESYRVLSGFAEVPSGTLLKKWKRVSFVVYNNRIVWCPQGKKPDKNRSINMTSIMSTETDESRFLVLLHLDVRSTIPMRMDSIEHMKELISVIKTYTKEIYEDWTTTERPTH